MYEEDYYNILEENEFNNNNNREKWMDKMKRTDKGFNVITVKDNTKYNWKGYYANKEIVYYTSCGNGNYIRDAETGEYFDYKVGSKDEDLFFKVMLATGECTSRNGSCTAFFSSPQHYMNFFSCKLNPSFIQKWEDKRDARLIEIKRTHKKPLRQYL